MFNGIFATGFIGGGINDLDYQDGADLQQDDLAIVVDAGEITFYYLDAASGEAESSPDIIAPDTNAGTKRWKLMPTGGGAGATGAGEDEVFLENDQNVTTDYTLTADKNAMSAGPITIDAGVTVTIPTGATWTVV